ncbi:hypothetical protein CC79DRAFT_1129255 [Sarocladium strictum]
MNTLCWRNSSAVRSASITNSFSINCHDHSELHKSHYNLSLQEQLAYQGFPIFPVPILPCFKYALHVRHDLLSIVRPGRPGRQIRWIPPHPGNRFWSNPGEFLIQLINLFRLIAATENHRARKPTVIHHILLAYLGNARQEPSYSGSRCCEIAFPSRELCHSQSLAPAEWKKTCCKTCAQ